MIHHLSIAARDPRHVAEVLAKLMGGATTPFPPHPGSYFAIQPDDHGSGIEVYPAGTQLQPGGAAGGHFVQDEPQGYGPTHFALSVSLDRDRVMDVAKTAGWQCYDCDRGPFHVIELWLENVTMVEILPPQYAREYLAFTQPETFKAAMAAVSSS